MEAQFKFIKIQMELSGWATINVEQISEVLDMPNKTSVYLIMASGRSYIVNGRYAQKIREQVSASS